MNAQPTLRPHCAAIVLPLLAAAFLSLGTLPTRADDSISDARITRWVESTLNRDHRIPSHLIDVKVDRGVVTLQGSVDNLHAKHHAVAATRSLRGVRGVVDELTVRPIEMTDEELESIVAAEISCDPITWRNEVTATVKAGVVTLSGTVPSYAERRLCQETIAGIAGVRDVVDDMEIVLPEKRTDEDILAEIEAEMRENVWLDDANIEVTVKDGKVSLHGSVPTPEELYQAELEAFVVGVTHVDVNGLQVRPLPGGSRHKLTEIRNRTEIAEELRTELEDDPRVDAAGVIVEVENGAVTLRGQVRTYRAKLAAGEDAADAVGVWSVDNEIRVRPEKLRPDKDVAQDVRDAIGRDAYLHRHDLHVFVLNSQVFLRGQVQTPYEVLRAEEVAARVPGVVTVTNGLTSLASLHGPSDDAIREAIVHQLSLNPLIQSKRIDVTVTNRVAILSGTVFDWKEQRAAVRSAFQGGAHQVINELRPLHGPDVLRP